MGIWREITYDGQTLHHIGIKIDGTLWNPNGYPEGMVRTAIAGAEARAHERRSKAAHKAAATRARRRVLKINRIVQEYQAKGVLQPARTCRICSRGLSDQESIDRGIGSECWQDVLAAITAQTAAEGEPTGEPAQSQTG